MLPDVWELRLFILFSIDFTISISSPPTAITGLSLAVSGPMCRCPSFSVSYFESSSLFCDLNPLTNLREFVLQIVFLVMLSWGCIISLGAGVRAVTVVYTILLVPLLTSNTLLPCLLDQSALLGFFSWLSLSQELPLIRLLMSPLLRFHRWLFSCTCFMLSWVKPR